jgi:peptidoglycan hydrolase-like protein with peptidoglycan-binding domain
MRKHTTPKILRIGLVALATTISFWQASTIVCQAQSSRSMRPVRAKVEEIREAEQRLSDIGYWTGPVDGRFDAASRQALIAFQKLEGLKPTGVLGPNELEVLRNAVPPQPRESGYAHVEVDLALQVLFFVNADGTVTHILPVSSGSGQPFTSEGWTRNAVTPKGKFSIQRKLEGWKKGPLGSIYYPNYFVAGVAIHGLSSVPATPASHGCVRIPIFASKEFSEMTPLGTTVIIHDGSVDPRSAANTSGKP